MLHCLRLNHNLISESYKRHTCTNIIIWVWYKHDITLPTHSPWLNLTKDVSCFTARIHSQCMCHWITWSFWCQTLHSEGQQVLTDNLICYFLRNLLLKVSLVVVLCFHWLERIAVEPESRGLQVTNILILVIIVVARHWIVLFAKIHVWLWPRAPMVRCENNLKSHGFFVFVSSTVLGELCGSRTVSPAPDGLHLHSALHFFGGVPVEARHCFITHRLFNFRFCCLLGIKKTLSAFPRLFTKHVLRRKRKPVFDIARNVLELIYGQTLTW